MSATFTPIEPLLDGVARPVVAELVDRSVAGMRDDAGWNPVIDMTSLRSSITRDSYYDFLKCHWDTMAVTDPVWNWHIEYLCGVMQDAAERVFRGEPKKYDIVINVPPGTTKSTICSVGFMPWVWTRFPQGKSINGSHTDSLALDLSRKSRDVVQSELYAQLYPEVKIRADQNTKSYYANDKGGMRYSVGVGGSVIGMHGHFLTIDDPIDPEKSLSTEELKTVNRWCSMTLPSRKVDKQVALTFLIMQRLHQDDPTGNWLERRRNKDGTYQNLHHICLPAETGTLGGKHGVIPIHLYDNYVDGMLDPVRLSRKTLAEALVDLGQFGYAGQFMQNPIPLTGGMFKTDRLNFGVPPLRDKFKHLIRYWDKASTKGGGSWTVGLLMGKILDPFTKRPTYWVLDVIRGQWSSEERERIIHQAAKDDGKKVIAWVEQEGGSGGKESAEGTVARLSSSGHRCRVDKRGGSNDGDKVQRADTYSVAVNNGDVWLPEGAFWLHEYVQEMQYFPSSKYKDQIDASSGAFNGHTKRVIQVGAF